MWRQCLPSMPFRRSKHGTEALRMLATLKDPVDELVRLHSAVRRRDGGEHQRVHLIFCPGWIQHLQDLHEVCPREDASGASPGLERRLERALHLEHARCCRRLDAEQLKVPLMLAVLVWCWGKQKSGSSRHQGLRCEGNVAALEGHPHLARTEIGAVPGNWLRAEDEAVRHLQKHPVVIARHHDNSEVLLTSKAFPDAQVRSAVAAADVKRLDVNALQGFLEVLDCAEVQRPRNLARLGVMVLHPRLP
mmetsp:Transcript_59381/g.133816  ORF Transcript_59381/g.133816 Transcript_59381/m.133816 type:complete len:248 (+) Transcript_59381:74-817(+)